MADNRNPNRNKRPNGGQNSRPRQPQNAQNSANRRPAQKPAQKAAPKPAPKREPVYEEDNSAEIASTVKGMLAVAITAAVVCIFVILFAKSLFVSDAAAAKNIKTGHLTETEYVTINPEMKADIEEVVSTTTAKKKKKKTTTAKEEEEEPEVSLPEGIDQSIAGTYKVNSAVYLHPEPNSSSANLATLPAGASVEVYGNSNYGWYYLEYDGQYGYAWSSYFTKG